MDQQKDKESNKPKESVKLCSKAKEHSSRISSVAAPRKYAAHSGIKFNNVKKLTVVKPFHFHTSSKAEKGSPEKQAKAEEKTTKDAVNLKKTECLKISKDSQKSSKTVSGERTPKTPVNDTPKDKKVCSRSSREAKSQEEISKTSTPKLQTCKAANSEIQASNVIKFQKKSSKIATPQKLSSSTKQQVHFLEAEEPEAKSSNPEKTDSSNGESSNALTSKSESGTLNGTKSESDSSSAEAAGSFSSYGLGVIDENKLSDAESEPLSGPGTNEPLNGNAEIQFSNGISLESELFYATKIVESTVQKTASKIPRKTFGVHSGLKFHANFKKSTIPQPFSFENRFKKESINEEAMILTN